MPIKAIDLTNDVAVQTCSICEDEHDISLVGLKLGTNNDPNVMTLPPCPNCGGQEFAIRTFEEIPTGRGLESRVNINKIAVHLKAKGRIKPDLASLITSETVSPTITQTERAAPPRPPRPEPGKPQP